MSGAIDVIQHFLEEFNRGKLHAVDHHLAPEYFASAPPEGDPPANVTLHGLASDLRAALPDLTIELSEVERRGDHIEGTLSLRGTHQGPLWGAPASGVPFAWDVHAVFRVEGDRFAFALTDLEMPDVIGAVRQLGLVNPPDQMHLPLEHPVVLPEFLLRAIFTGSSGAKPCSHLGQIRYVDPDTDVCARCVASGDVWPALRMCLICGFVGCCDTAINTHMKAHYEETGHPIFRSIRMDEGWIWCYEDSAFFGKRTLDHYR